MNVVFDLGGVVFDWRPAAVVAAALPAHAARAEALARGIFQGFGGDWAEFDRGTVEPDDLAVRLADRTGLQPAEVRRVIDAVAPSLVPNPATLALIDALKARGDRVFYLSNMPAPYIDYIERQHPFRTWFDTGVFSSRVREIKPDAAIFRIALERFGAAAADCLFLDDHPPNVDAARSLGWQALHFTDAAAARRALGLPAA